jgi:glutathione synthase/RimK-type ligase-like ATP-grasp enzyme
MRRISVLIPDAATQLSTRVAHCLKASGRVSVHGLSGRRTAPQRLSNLFSTFEFSTEGIGLSSWLERIDDIVARRQIDVVLPISDFGIRALSEHGRLLACTDRLVQLPEHHIFDVATNKASLANLLAVHGIPRPATIVVHAGKQRSENLSALTFPVLAKPSLLAGGQGIQRCESPAELERLLAGKPEGEIWVVQEYIDGHDICVNVLCQNGKVVVSTTQHAVDQSSCSYKPPHNFEFKFDSSAADLARRLMEKLSWSGIANIDMRFDVKRKAPVVLEVNGRYWASLLGSLHAGVNFPLLACEAVSGQIFSNRRPHKARYFRGKTNVLRSLIGGGKLGVRPSETDLSYFFQDPLRLAWLLTTRVTGSVRDKLPGRYARGIGDRPVL